MSEPIAANVVDVRAQLHSLSAALRQVDHLDADARQRLAELVEELSIAMGSDSSDKAIHLSESAARLMRALQENHEGGALEAGRKRLQKLIVSAETEAPVLTGIAERLIRVLSDIGI